MKSEFSDKLLGKLEGLELDGNQLSEENKQQLKKAFPKVNIIE